MLADSSPYLAAGFGLIGTLVGAGIAGGFSLRIAREARTTAEHEWIRENRREIYDRYLVGAQTLHLACEEAFRPGAPDGGEAVRTAFAAMLNTYSVVQTVAERQVIDAARVYTYRLIELRDVLEGKGIVGRERFGEIAQLVRAARHDAIDAMRDDLALQDSARPGKDFNPFGETPFAAAWAVRRRRPDDPGGPGDPSAPTWSGSLR